jgi:hypothetical protein
MPRLGLADRVRGHDWNIHPVNPGGPNDTLLRCSCGMVGPAESQRLALARAAAHCQQMADDGAEVYRVDAT